MILIKNKTLLNIILLFSIFALLCAYYIQYVLGHMPCNLCLLERLPYVAAIIIITLFLILKKFEKIVFILLGLIFFGASILSFYHFGIEQGFFEESMVCNLNSEIKDITKENLLKELKKKTISCKIVTFKILGLSLASINTFLSLALSFITIKKFLKYEKNK
jgi:disulfide bond formation protein DsbB